MAVRVWVALVPGLVFGVLGVIQAVEGSRQSAYFWGMLFAASLAITFAVVAYRAVAESKEDARLPPLRDLLAENLRVGRSLAAENHHSFWDWRENTREFIRQALGEAEAEVFATSPMNGQSVPATEVSRLTQPFLDNHVALLKGLPADTRIPPAFKPESWFIDPSEGPKRY